MGGREGEWAGADSKLNDAALFRLNFANARAFYGSMAREVTESADTVDAADIEAAGAPARAGWRHPGALARRRRAFWIGPLILVNLGLLIAAWFLPLMTLKAGCVLWDAMCLARDETSLAGTVAMLAGEREWLLLVVIGGFAMLFPALKLIAAAWVWARVDAASPSRSRAFGWMQALGKWSMIDVFVVALIVVGVKVSLISDVDVHLGIYVFTGAVALSILVMSWLERGLRPRA